MIKSGTFGIRVYSGTHNWVITRKFAIGYSRTNDRTFAHGENNNFVIVICAQARILSDSCR